MAEDSEKDIKDQKDEQPKTSVQVVKDDSKLKKRIKELEEENAGLTDQFEKVVGERDDILGKLNKLMKTPSPENKGKSVWEDICEICGFDT
jgi:chromosome segregation ATPase